MKHKIFSHTSLLIILSVILTFLAAGTVMYNRYDIYMKQGVRDEAAYIKTGLEEDGQDFLTDKIGDATSSRITLLGKDGDVLFDSIENPSEMENHSDRPEFIEAEKKGFGEMVRYSDTLSKQTFYYAIKLKDDQVLRVARTTDSLLMTMLSSFLLLGGLVCVILMIEIFLVQKQTRKLIEPINQIDLEQPLNDVCYEELRPLLFRLDQQNRQIQKQLEDLKNAESVRKEFTANVSHELKTPITILKGHLSGMLQGVGEYRDRNYYLQRSLETTEKMEDMVKELLTVSRIENNKFITQKTDIAEQLRLQIADMAELIENKKLELQVEIPEHLYADVNPVMMDKVFSNLLLNAIRYTPEEKENHIRVLLKPGTDTETVYCQIENTGVFIPEEALVHLFEAFYRMEQSRNRQTGGSGLGLYIVKMILDQHGASYRMGNTCDGVCFSFSL